MRRLEELWEGSDELFQVSIESDGFNIDEDDLEITLVGEKGSTVHKKDDLLHDDNNQWYVMVETEKLGVGIVTAVTTLIFPDPLCPGGIRRDVEPPQTIAIIRELPKTRSHGMCRCNF